MEVFTLDDRPTTPLVVSVPHAGTRLSAGLARRLTDAAVALPDTDWCVPELYDFVPGMGGSVLCATYSRYVVDLNRDPDGGSLYPGQATTGLVPRELFDGRPVYREGEAPSDDEIRARRRDYFDPWHAALSRLLDVTVDRWGYALLWDAHSIAPVVQRLFDGTLPDLNLGTNRGASCAPEIEAATIAAMAAESHFTHITNGRFLGGWITRHYGRPESHVHALQMELSQATHLRGDPPRLDDGEGLHRLKTTLKSILQAALDAAASLYGER